MKGIILYLLCVATVLPTGLPYLKVVVVMEQLENSFCVKVLEESNAAPKLGLILTVNYPQSFAEAGEVIIGGDQLTVGFHNVSYKHMIKNMTHDLQVMLDGRPQKFLKSAVPRWYSVSTFREVLVLVQGDVLLQCLRDNESKDEKSSIEKSAGNGFTESIFLKGDEVKTSITTPPKMNSREFSFPHHLIEILVNETRSSNINDVLEFDVPNSDLSINNSNDVESLKQVETILKPNLKDQTPLVTLKLLNQSDLESGQTQTMLECISGDCFSTPDHDYTVAYVLSAVLGLMVLVAIVISVVFHKKKKRLLRANKTSQQNRLRETQVEDSTSDQEESQMMLGEVNNTYEIIN